MIWFLPVVVPVCIWVAIKDVSEMRIPNRAVLVLLIGFIALWPFVVPWPDIAWRGAQFLALLCLCFALTCLGLMGAGDAKFIAVASLYVDMSHGKLMLGILFACLLGSVAIHRLARSIPAVRLRFPDWQSWDRRDFPMGLPLGAALLGYLILTAA